MSNAAVTAPGKRNSFLTQKFRTSERTQRSTSVASTSKEYSDAQKPENAQKPSKRVRKRPSQVKKTATDNDESWMGRAQRVMQSALNKIEPKSTMHSTTASNTKKLNSRPDPGKQTIKIMSIPHYEQMEEEKVRIREENVSLRSRITELEEEITKIVSEFETLYADNEKLRKKLDTGSKPLLEPYSRVFEDRDMLREAELGYKKRISKLEHELRGSNERCDKLEENLKSSKAKIQKMKEKEGDNKAAILKLAGEKKDLEIENGKLKAKITEMEGEKDAERCLSQQQGSLNANSTVSVRSKDSHRAPRRKLTRIYSVTKELPNSYREQFLLRQNRFDYEYNLPDSDFPDW